MPFDPVFHECDAADLVYNVTRGMLKLYKFLPDGLRQLMGFVQAGDLCNEPVADAWELQVRDEGMSLLIAWEVLGVEHVRPQFPAVQDCFTACSVPDLVHVIFDGRCFV